MNKYSQFKEAYKALIREELLKEAGGLGDFFGKIKGSVGGKLDDAAGAVKGFYNKSIAPAWNKEKANLAVMDDLQRTADDYVNTLRATGNAKTQRNYDPVAMEVYKKNYEKAKNLMVDEMLNNPAGSSLKEMQLKKQIDALTNVGTIVGGVTIPGSIYGYSKAFSNND